MQMSGARVGAGFYAVHWNMKEECYSYNPANPTATHVPPRRAKKLEQEPRRSSRTTCNAVLPGPKSSTKPTEKPLCLGVDQSGQMQWTLSEHLLCARSKAKHATSLRFPPPNPTGEVLLWSHFTSKKATDEEIKGLV